MYNLKNFLITIWASVKVHAVKAIERIISLDSTRGNDVLKAKDCLFRTKIAYQSLTGFPIHNLITLHTVDRLARTCRNYDELATELDNTSASDDKLYCFLLVIASAKYINQTKPLN